jgi:hypothetical protein
VAKAEYRAGTIEEVAKLWTMDSTNVVSVAHHLHELLQENIEHIARSIRTNTRFTVQEPKDEEEEEKPQTICRTICEVCSRLTIDDMIRCEHGEIRPPPPERTEVTLFRGRPVYLGHTTHFSATPVLDYEDVSPPQPPNTRLIREDRLRALYDTAPGDALREVGLPVHAEENFGQSQRGAFLAYVGGAVGREMFAQAQLEMYRIPLPEEPEPQPQGPATALYDQRSSTLRAGSQQYQAWRDAHDTDYVLPDLPNLPDESESL